MLILMLVLLSINALCFAASPTPFNFAMFAITAANTLFVAVLTRA